MNHIPKIIHYCWFGGNPLPEMAVKCIDSWKKFFPDYEIKEWNESNFDVHCCNYVEEAYQARKWAFVSDYARFWILYREGGLYFDTDVEVIKPFDDILDKGAFMGCEIAIKCVRGLNLGVNPGLGLGANPGLGLYKEILDSYNTRHFMREDGSVNVATVVDITTEILKQHGWRGDGTIERVCDVNIYPPDYFCPMDYCTGQLNITANSHSIHWYSASWFTQSDRIIMNIQRWCNNRFGKDNRIHRVLDFPFRVCAKLEKLGFINTVKFTINKITNRE